MTGMPLPDKDTVADGEGASRRRTAAARSPRASGEGARTRGGWTPAGTAAGRRAAQAERSTPRGQRTRREITEAARRVFERDGYLDANVDDIVAEAGVARGSFYTYFRTKMDVFRVLTIEVSQAIDSALVRRIDDERLDPVAALAESNLRYMAVYRQNAAIYALIEQLGHIDPEIDANRRTRRVRDIERVSRSIRRWQSAGVADPSVDAEATAAALIAMTRHECYWFYVGGDQSVFSEAEAAEAINRIWVRAVDLRRAPNPEWLD
jgi:AcrR family transcriptional regulator